MVNGKIGGAVIGCGGMGSWHAEKMSKYMNDRMELVGIYDINLEKTRKPKKRAGMLSPLRRSFLTMTELIL